MLTLWDLIKPKRQRKRKPKAASRGRGQSSVRKASTTKASIGSMQKKYERTVRECLATHHVRVRKWRTSMSGCAWEVVHHDGRVTRLIEAPKPKGPMSTAVFLHEIGHHAIGLGRYRPRCLEEYHAWAWSLGEMERRGLNVTDAVRRRMRESLQYAVDKARRRGLKHVPEELTRALASKP